MYNQNFNQPFVPSFDNNHRNDYYNYINNNYNKPLYTEDANANKLYDPLQGLYRGNMFPNLYNGYKVNTIEIKPANEQARMLTYLDALCFATLDLNLYLDLFPDDKDILALFNQYRSEENKLKAEYESKYGPILISSNANQAYPFPWIDSPWPWETK